MHAGAVLLLVAHGTPRPLPDADTGGPGIPVIFPTGAGGELPGEADTIAPAEASAEPMPVPPERAAAPDAAEARFDGMPAPATASALPLPPRAPPEPQHPARSQARLARAAPGDRLAPPTHSGGSDATASPQRDGAAALLLADRGASVGRRVDPVVPIEARRARLQGTVVLAVTVSPEGVPSAVDVLRSSGHLLLDRAAQEALWHWRFDPARRGGLPVEERIAIPVTFRIVD